jgi:hypothetical protein
MRWRAEMSLLSGIYWIEIVYLSAFFSVTTESHPEGQIFLKKPIIDKPMPLFSTFNFTPLHPK